MAKYLVVVESPAKAKTINKFLGSNYLVRASFGHVRDLPKSDLGVDIDNNFQPKYVTLRDSSKHVKALKEAAAKVDKVLIASDPDREGEAIGWHVAEILRKTKKLQDLPIERIVFNEITKRSVRDAAKHARDIDHQLVDAQQARRVLDRLVGYKLSPWLGWTVRRGLSAGRVQSVAVRMVCEREEEIRAFVPVEYWSLAAELATEAGDTLTAKLTKVRGEKVEVGSELIGSREAMLDILRGLGARVAAAPEAQASGEDAPLIVIDSLDGVGPFNIQSVEKKELRRRPAPPFITSSLQQEASRKLRYSPRQTMRIAQQLYEGIDLGPGGTDGLITYMRTDSTRVSGEALQQVRDHIEHTYTKKYLPGKPNFYSSKKGAQDAHEAIRPTQPTRTPDSVAQYLNDEQLKVYTLVWKRFVASQMLPAVFDQTTIDLESGDYGFRATGSVLKFDGFTKIYEESKDDPAENGNGAKLLPAVKEGERLSARDLNPNQHFTKPPPRYSEASLIRALEENGIGRPSTYAPTVNTIVDREYVARERGRLYPTELGEEVNALLVKWFPDILDYNFTAQLESDLDHVEEGTREWHDLIRDFYSAFAKDLELAQKSKVTEMLGDDVKCPKCGSAVEWRESWFGPFLGCTNYPDCDGTISLRKKAPVEKTDEKCDKCGSDMVIRTGRWGKFMACSAYPKCKNTIKLDKDGNKVEDTREEPVRTDEQCPDCGGVLLIRKNRRGEPFYGCEKYPKCKFTKPAPLGIPCPKCGKDLVSKLAKRRRFIGCEAYPDCDFTAFGQLDRETACPKCGNEWTTVTKKRGGPQTRHCPKPDCDYEEVLPEEE